MKDVLRVAVTVGLFLVPLLTLYVSTDLFFPYITGKNFSFRILVGAVFALWVLLALLDARYRPRFSFVLASFAALVAVVFLSSLVSEHPPTSFFSNFERMDGFITLVHVFLYLLVLGSMFVDRREWRRYFYFTLAVAFFVSLHGLAQYGGLIEGYRGRIEGVLGNAAYMAIYLFFHIFIAFWLFVENKRALPRALLAALALLFIFVLIETGTRGTAIGLIAGVTVMVAYIAIFGARFREFRAYAAGALLLLFLAGGALFAARDSEFVQGNQNLARIANISLDQLEVRLTIWGMAWEGVKERPLLGWGHGNFGYVFNKHYDPSLYGQEQWFDRVHNIVFDWLIAAGILGLLAYTSIFIACLYYLIWRPLRRPPAEEEFSVLERGVLLGILAGYLTHNLVVFDNIVSYIFFAMLLAFIHSRVARALPALSHGAMHPQVVAQFAAPIAFISFAALVWLLHVPGIQAANDIIRSYRADSPEAQLDAFRDAIARRSVVGRQEIVEQLSQQAINAAGDAEVAEETRREFVTLAEAELLRLIEDKPRDVRLHMFLGTLYRAVGDLNRAADEMVFARSLSPRKQSIIAKQGAIELARNNREAARDFFREAFTLDERNLEARINYAAALFYAGEPEAAKALMEGDVYRRAFAGNDFLVGAVHAAGDLEFLARLFEERVRQDPTLAQSWASLAFIYHQAGQLEAAVDALARGAEAVPSFAPTASCISGNLRAGREPQAGC
jgi:O-antigen ligase/Flp pilus assembly protein TadD